MQKRFAVGLFTIGVLFMLVSSPVAQGTIIRVTQLFLNGNRLTAASGTAVVTIPNTTQTLLGTTTICTTANWCQYSVALTDAQIKALPTTPITLVAAPGSGFWVRALAASISTNTSAGAYTNINVTSSTIQLAENGQWVTVPWLINDTTTTPDLTQMTDALGAAGRVVSGALAPYGIAHGDPGYYEWWNRGVYFATVDVENKALQISIDNNGSGNLTGGNSANRLRVTAYYAIEAVQP